MKKDNFLDVFDDQQKAIDHAMWLNFKYRIAVLSLVSFTDQKITGQYVNRLPLTKWK